MKELLFFYGLLCCVKVIGNRCTPGNVGKKSQLMLSNFSREGCGKSVLCSLLNEQC